VVVLCGERAPSTEDRPRPPPANRCPEFVDVTVCLCASGPTVQSRTEHAEAAGSRRGGSPLPTTARHLCRGKERDSGVGPGPGPPVIYRNGELVVGTVRGGGRQRPIVTVCRWPGRNTRDRRGGTTSRKWVVRLVACPLTRDGLVRGQPTRGGRGQQVFQRQPTPTLSDENRGRRSAVLREGGHRSCFPSR